MFFHLQIRRSVKIGIFLLTRNHVGWVSNVIRTLKDLADQHLFSSAFVYCKIKKAIVNKIKHNPLHSSFQTTTATRTPPNKRSNEGNDSCARALEIFEHFFAVLCKITTKINFQSIHSTRPAKRARKEKLAPASCGHEVLPWSFQNYQFLLLFKKSNKYFNLKQKSLLRFFLEEILTWAFVSFMLSANIPGSRWNDLQVLHVF